MRLSLLALALGLLAAPAAAAAEKRIIGGSTVSIANHPYQVKVETLGLGDCGGSIRDATHVITAAHCVVEDEAYFPFIVDPADVTVGYGDTDQTQLDIRDVSRVSVHPRYLRDDLGPFEFDVAVLTLDAPITFGTGAPALPASTRGCGAHSCFRSCTPRPPRRRRPSRRRTPRSAARRVSARR